MGHVDEHALGRGDVGTRAARPYVNGERHMNAMVVCPGPATPRRPALTEKAVKVTVTRRAGKEDRTSKADRGSPRSGGDAPGASGACFGEEGALLGPVVLRQAQRRELQLYRSERPARVEAELPPGDHRGEPVRHTLEARPGSRSRPRSASCSPAPGGALCGPTFLYCNSSPSSSRR